MVSSPLLPNQPPYLHPHIFSESHIQCSSPPPHPNPWETQSELQEADYTSLREQNIPSKDFGTTNYLFTLISGATKSMQQTEFLERSLVNVRYADGTSLMAESEEELKSLLMRVTEESEKAGLKHS